MNTHKKILAAIIFMLCHSVTFSMNQTKLQNDFTLGVLHQLPPIRFHLVSNRDELWQNRMLNKSDGLFSYPCLCNELIRQEPHCITWYNTAFEKNAQMNLAILKAQNVSLETLNRYFRRLAAEQCLTLSIVESVLPENHKSAIPSYFYPQFHQVDTNEKLRSAFSFNENGFYSYPKPAHVSIDANTLKNVYKAALKMNVDRAHYIGLPNECIVKHIEIIFAFIERYQYDIEQAQQNMTY